MSLTNRILLAMVAGIALGSVLEWLMSIIDPASGLHAFIEDVFWKIHIVALDSFITVF